MELSRKPHDDSAEMKPRPFLTAEWRHLVMLNYAVDPEVLRPLVPAGTELDFHEGRTFVSMVGFRFLRTRVFGIAIPLHTDFEEVNLRFYVRRRAGAEWRRGVVFVREIVPRRAIAIVARVFYGEPYVALPMRHVLAMVPPAPRAEYSWKYAGRWNSVGANAKSEPEEALPGSEAQFITEHYWGYTALGAATREYEVEHPRWRLWPASGSELDCDIANLYGASFVEALSGAPSSAFIAEGSPVVVRYPTMLPPTS